MAQKLYKLLLNLLTISFLFLNSCSSDFAFVDRDIRYIHSRINTVAKTSITLQDGTKWGFGRFSINTPSNEVIVTYYESSIGGTAYIDGIEKSVSFLGTIYDNSTNINDIIQFNEGRLSYISQIDSSGAVISLDDSTNWIVRPDQREAVKKWTENERVILDNGKQFIINPRIYEMAEIKQLEIVEQIIKE
ncbi:MAG: hypothetical protein L3J41_16720 [Melioribacteraceae bacterium]|nr:hypothetical protein [Melioribacteraceae bacterium]